MARKLSIPVSVYDAAGKQHELEVGVSVHEPAGEACGADICYLHGGGLLYGERDDLPQPYVREIVARGHRLVCLDYPLAPAVDAGAITQAVLDELAWLCEREQLGSARPLVLFGRSAGAYLALRACADILAGRAAACVPAPAALWSFYGYHDLTAPFVSTPSRHYAKMPAVSKATVERLVAGDPVTAAPISQRFSAYMYARQTGTWGELIGAVGEQAAARSISTEELAAFPPTFLTASSGDNDVPFGTSKAIARAIPHAKMHSVYYLEHDFDRDTSKPEGAEAYALALAWLDEVLAG